MLHVARHRDARWHIHFAIEHVKDGLELRVLDYSERAVATRTPHREEKPKARGGIGRAVREGSDSLALRRVLRLAGVRMALEVPRGILVVAAIDMFRGLPRKNRSARARPGETEIYNLLLAHEAVHDHPVRAAHDDGVLEMVINAGAPPLRHCV